MMHISMQPLVHINIYIFIKHTSIIFANKIDKYMYVVDIVPNHLYMRSKH